MSKDYIFEPRPVYSSYTPNLFLGTYYIEDGFQADPSMWANPLEDAFVTNAGMKEGKIPTVTDLNEFSAETLLMKTKKLDELDVLPQSYFWKWDHYDTQIQIPTEISEDDFEYPAYEEFMEAAVGYDSDNPYFLSVVDSFMDEGEDVDIWAEEADWSRIQTTVRWWQLYDLWMEAEGVDFLKNLAHEDYDWSIRNAGELQQIGYELPEPDDDDFYWSMRQAENEGHWSTFGRVDYNWETVPEDLELTDEQFWRIDEGIRSEVRYRIDSYEDMGEDQMEIVWQNDGLFADEYMDFTVNYYWGPARVTGVNSAESFEGETLMGNWVDGRKSPGIPKGKFPKKNMTYGELLKFVQKMVIQGHEDYIINMYVKVKDNFDDPDYLEEWVVGNLGVDKGFELSVYPDEALIHEAESFEAPYTGAGSLMGISGDTDLSSFTPDELTKSSAIHGDFDTASLDYSGHQNIEVRAEEWPSNVNSPIELDNYESKCYRCKTDLTEDWWEEVHDEQIGDWIVEEGGRAKFYRTWYGNCPSCRAYFEFPDYNFDITDMYVAESMTKIYSFKELSEEAQTKAVADYIEGWEETHEIGDMEYLDALSALKYDYPMDGLDHYKKDGTWTQQYKSEEGDNEDWDDSSYDPQAALESIWENWHDEWMIGEANEDVVNQIAEAVVKNDPAGNLVIVDNYGWYLKLSNEQREDILTKPYLNEIIQEIIERIAESWDDQFQSENDYFDKYGGIYEDGRPCPFCGLNNMAENACGTPGNDMCNDCCSKSGGCGHCPVYCPACGNEDVNNLNGLEFSCDKCDHIWNI